MNILLDTHTLAWYLNGESILSEKVKSAIESESNTTFVSIVSIWEVAIKMSLNKFKFPGGLNKFLKLIDENGFEILPVTLKPVLIVAELEYIHRDPFDRILISQCIAESLVFATKDQIISKYNVITLW
ncbi:MAG: type II toxin-antitoxin system VapC family toxin [Bacteroidia bacterium]